MRSFTIGSKTITQESGAYVCAELSHSHFGSLELAREMIRLAAEAGVDAVKLQRRGPSTYAGLRAAGEGEYADMREARELGWEPYYQLMQYAHSRGLAFITTAFDQESADFLMEIEERWSHVGGYLDAFKIASGDITNTPLLEYVATLGTPMLVSTGGADMEDVREAHDALTKAKAHFCLLHCTTEYPVYAEHVNLRVIETYRRTFPETVIGFSSHLHRDFGRPGECLAYLLGARIFEKHFTITPDIGTGEHAFACTPKTLRNIVLGLDDTRRILGDGVKVVKEEERLGILRLGKHLVYARALPAGHILSPADFRVEAPGNGVPPNRAARWAGWTLTRAVEAGDMVVESDVEPVAS